MPAKKCPHKYKKYPKSMLRKTDGCLKKSMRKKAAKYRRTHTQAGKLRKKRK